MKWLTDTAWWSRNRKKRSPILTVIVFGGVCGMFVLVRGMITSSGAYTEALTRIRSNRQVTEQLGTPLEAGWLVRGSISSKKGESGSARLTIPVSGPDGSATLYVQAHESAGRWTFCRLIVQTKSTGKRIDLLDENRVDHDRACTQHQKSEDSNPASPAPDTDTHPK